MLKFKKVEAQNYKSFKNFSLELENRGLMLIEGENKANDSFDSNAAGKCISGDSEIYSVMKGRKVPLKEFVRDRETKTLGITDTYRTIEVEVTDWHELGIKEMMKITTDVGEEIITAGTHPFLTPTGTEKAEDLKEGDFVAVTRFLPLGEGVGLSNKFLYSLGALIGDGGMTSGEGINLTNMEQEIFDAVEEGIQEEFPDIYFSHDYDRRAKTKSMTRALLTGGVRRDTHPFFELIENLGLRVLSKEKDIPQDLMGRLNREQVISILSGLYNTDGEVPNSKNKDPRRTITYTTASKKLAYKIKDLWLMLRIPVSVRPRKVKGRGDQLYWRISTYSNTWDDVIKNLNLVGEPRDRLRDVDLYFKNKYEGMTPRNNKDVIPYHFNHMLETTPAIDYNLSSGRKPHRTRNQLGTKSFSREIYGKWAGNNILSESDVTWVRIDSITKEPPEYCYDITVDNDNHLYVADNFIVHNSSLLEAISYAIYDIGALSVRADEVINRKEGKDTFVKLHLEQNGVPYRIERYRKHTEHKNKVLLFQDGKEITGGTNRDTNEMIEDIVGVSIETYMNSIMYGQGTEPLFSEATDKGKKEILENITSISIYAKAQEIAREKVAQKKLAEQEIDVEEQHINNQLAGIKESVEREKERYESIKAMIDSREVEYERAKAERKKFPQTNLRSLINKLKEIDKPQPEFEEDLTYVNQFKGQLTDIEQKSQEFMQAINQLVAQKDNKLQEQNRLDTTDVCPTCGTKMSNEHALLHHKELQSEIEQLQTTIKTYREQYEAVFQPQIDKIKGDLRFAEIDVETRRQEYNDERYKLQSEIQQVTGQIQIYENEKEQLIREVENTKRALEEVKSLPKPDERKKEIEKLNKGLEEIKDKRNSLFIAKTQYEDAVKAFSNKGIRSVVLDLVTPTLTNSANKYLNILSESILQVEFTTQVENASGELADRFDVMVIHNGEETTFQTLSQGEKTRVNVAISLALQDLVYSNSHLKTNLALYDEVFDGLDDRGVSSVIEILEEKAKEIGTVFVITHSNTMKPLFESVITVEKEDGVSKIEGE